MQKYARVINAKNKMCQVGIGTNTEFYVSLGMELTEVEQGPDGNWYLAGHAPTEAEPTLQEQVQAKEEEYGLNRATRTALLALQAQGVELDEQLMARVAEVEEAAQPLRN